MSASEARQEEVSNFILASLPPAEFEELAPSFERASFGVGYVFNRIALRNGNEDLVAQIEPLHQGPSVFVSASF